MAALSSIWRISRFPPAPRLPRLAPLLICDLPGEPGAPLCMALPSPAHPAPCWRGVSLLMLVRGASCGRNSLLPGRLSSCCGSCSGGGGWRRLGASFSSEGRRPGPRPGAQACEAFCPGRVDTGLTRREGARPSSIAPAAGRVGSRAAPPPPPPSCFCLLSSHLTCAIICSCLASTGPSCGSGVSYSCSYWLQGAGTSEQAGERNRQRTSGQHEGTELHDACSVERSLKKVGPNAACTPCLPAPDERLHHPDGRPCQGVGIHRQGAALRVQQHGAQDIGQARGSRPLRVLGQAGQVAEQALQGVSGV